MIWNSDDVANFLRCNRNHFMARIAPLPDFPKPIIIPPGRNYRWKEEEVKDWVDGLRRA